MTENSTRDRGQDVLDGTGIIDCDAHVTEPVDLWTSRVPASLADQVPVQRTVDGYTSWYLNGDVWATIGGNTIGLDGEKVLGTMTLQPFELIHKSSWFVPDRLELMDRWEIEAQILYPNGIGFASNHIFAIEDAAQRQLVLQTYNDFLVEVQEASSGRLLPQALLPIWDMDDTVSEMTRLLDQGIRGFTLSDKPELLGLPELIEDYFAPMWDVFNESGAVANFHIAAGIRKEEHDRNRRLALGQPLTEKDAQVISSTIASPAWNWFGRQRSLAAKATQFYMSNARIIANMCLSDLFDRYPKLKVVSAESGIGWVPFVLEALEYQLDEMVTDPAELGLQKRRPTEYFRDHFYVMFWFEQNAPEKLIHDIGVGNVLVETDIPHPTCLYPDPKSHFTRVLSGLGGADQRRVIHDNAAELYRIPARVNT